jgi:RHS repeat-associated protein
MLTNFFGRARMISVKRFVVLLVIVSIFAPSISPILAQEASDAPSAPAEESGSKGVPLLSAPSDVETAPDEKLGPLPPVVEQKEASPEEASTKETDQKEEEKIDLPPDTEPQAMSMFSAGSGSPGKDSVASTDFNQNQFKIDKNTGAARTSYPIVIPPGRNGIQPDLTLLYNSQDGQKGSVFGEGWSVGIPYIERSNKRGVDALYSSSTPVSFSSTIDGELATTTVSTNYIARTENGSFNKYVFSNEAWTMTDKNGTTYKFGTLLGSRQANVLNTSSTYRWMLDEVRDKNDNYVSYTYFKDAGQIYPSSTVYTGSGGTPGIFQVDFGRTTNVDNSTSSANGFAVNSNYRISDITAKVNGSWVRKYELGYGTGDNGNTALLRTVTAFGQNASGTIAAFPTSTFSYQTQSQGWTADSAWNPLISFTATSSADNGSRIADVNGDGLPDIVQSYTNATGSYAGTYLNNGAGWTASSTWNAPLAFITGTTDLGVRITDVNGDGLPDFVQGYNDGSDHFAAYLNNGNGWTATSTWNPPIIFASGGNDTGARVVDVNGDGLPDIIRGYRDSGGSSQYSAYINTGSGWTSNSAWNPPTFFVASTTVSMGVNIADVNGDGLPDIVQGYNDGSDHFATYLNLGNGWATSTAPMWHLPVITNAIGGVDNGVRIVDVNGDGLADVIRAFIEWDDSVTYAAYLNNGAGWTSASLWNSPVGFTTNGADNGTRIVDANGDGLPDILQAHTDASGNTTYAAYLNNNRFRANLLSGITYPQGGSSAISYQSILQITDDNGYVLNKVPYPVYIVSKITTNDGTQNVATSTYAYYGGAYYTNGPFDHQFAGFDQVKETDPAGNITKTYFNAADSTNSGGEYQDNFWKIGKPYRIEAYDNASNLYQLTINRWDTYDLGSGAGFVKIASSTELDYDGLSTHKDKAEWNTYDNTTGNLTQKIQWGEVMASSTDGSFIDTAADKFITDISYATSVTNVIGKPSTSTVTNQSGTKIKETRYYYDNLSLGNVSVGNLTKQEDWKSASTYVNTQSTYNAYGLVTQQLDPRGKQTNYTYDTYNLYPATSTNALSQSTGYQYDYSTGKATRTIDPNGNTSVTTYDGFGRVLEMSQPDGNTTSTQALKTSYEYTDQTNGTRVRKSDYLDSLLMAGSSDFQIDTNNTLSTSLVSYYKLEDTTDSASTNNLTNNNTASFNSGKVNNSADGGSSNTNKYLSTATNLGFGTGPWSMAFWFNLDSSTGSSFPIGIQTNSPSDRAMYVRVISGGGGAIWGEYASGRGFDETRTVYSTTINTGTWYHVAYVYDGSTPVLYVNGSAVGSNSTQNSGGSGGFVNAFGTLAYPDTSYVTSVFPGKVDEAGVWNKALSAQEVTDLYNGGQGQTLTEQGTVGSVDTYTYLDGLGRPFQTRKSAEGLSTYKVADRIYDSRGLLQKESLPYFASDSARTAATTTAALFTSYAYDPLQRPLTITNAVGSTSNTYANWKTTVTDPRGKNKDQYADAQGNLVQVDEHNATSTYSTYYEYDGLKNLTKITDALGNVRNFTYDGLSRRLTAEDLHAVGDATYGTWAYTYDDAGNLTQTLDPKSQTVNYAYDDTNRATSEDFTGQGGTEYVYVYDSCTQGIGRLCVTSSTDAVVSKTYNRLGQLAQESKTISSSTYATSYTYDRQGNQLTITNPDGSVTTYTYNSAGLVETVSEQESGASSTVIISDIDYSPLDQVYTQTYASGMVAKNIYDPTHLYRLVGKVTSNGGDLFEHEDSMGSDLISLIDDGGGRLITTSTVTIAYTASSTTYTVPSDVFRITVTTNGAQGASSTNSGAGGLGGKAIGTLNVASGTIFYVNVGGQNGYNGGGSGAFCSGCGAGSYDGGNGGGFTTFAVSASATTSSILLLGAGGGGGGGAGAGGTGGGLTGNTGVGGGTALDGNGGSGATQNAGGAGGTASTHGGSNGTAGTVFSGGNGGNTVGAGNGVTGAGGGGGGLFGGGGGGGGGYDAGAGRGAGGAGGSSFVLATSTLSSTSTVSGANVGNGSVVIVEEHYVDWPFASSLHQYFADATTTLNRGSSTYETNVVIGAFLSATSSQSLRLEAEAEPMGRNFTNIPNVTSSAFAAPNRFATTTFSGVSGVGYHWQARAKDALGNPSPWVRFSSSTYTTDFTFKYFYVVSTSTYTGATSTYTVPPGVTKLIVSIYGAQGGVGSGSPGLGGAATGTLLVTPGTTYYYNVGQMGGSGGTSGSGPYSGGGGGGKTWFGTSSTFSTSTVLLSAGGGGGSGGDWAVTSGGSVSGGNGGYGGGGIGGSTNGTSPGAGGGGGGLYGGFGGSGSGGAAGTQSSGYALGQGGAGGNNIAVGASGCAGGDGGGTSGVNGSSCSNGAGGGGGGSAFVSTSTSLSATSTASGVRTGNGYIEIKGIIAPIIGLQDLNQYKSDGVTPLPDGDSTNEGKVIFGAQLTSEATSSMQLEVQVGAPNGTGTEVGTGSPEFEVDTNGTLTNSLISYYKAEDITDFWSTNNLTNNSSVSFVPGKIGNAAEFTKSPAKSLSIGSTLGIDGGAISVSLWVKPNSLPSGSEDILFSQFNNSSKVGYMLQLQDSGGTQKIRWRRVRWDSAENVAEYATTLSTSVFTHLVATYDGANLKLYINGTQQGSTTGSGSGGTASTSRTAIGAHFDSLGYGNPNADIDELGIWNRALSSTEISDLYNGGQGQTMSIPPFTYATSSPLVAPGSVATTSFSGLTGSYHWQARAVDPGNNNASDWQNFGASSSTVDFRLSPLLFTNPANGTTTSATALTNWQLKAANVTSTNSYRVNVQWGVSSFSGASSTANASGTALLSGINITKQIYSGDYTEAGIPVNMTAMAYLYDITATSTFIATTTVAFTEITNPGTSDCTSSNIQCIAYAYDANGNITKIVEHASTTAARTVDYAYDDLNRLISASSSNVTSGSNYSQTYSYNAIGNLLSGPAGTYSYAHASSSYANPHAPLSLTSTSTVVFAYDNSGNLTGSTIGTSTIASYTWDYRNRMTQSTGGATSTYAYDSAGQRIKLTVGTSTTIYPTGGYDVSGSSTVKQITANGMLLATIDKATSTAVMHYILTDHLGGTNVVTDDANTIIQTLDYYPYGAPRVKTGTDVSQREYIGQYYDEGTSLSYLNARYYSSDRGQFTSQDPVFWSSKQNLKNPQSLNSYSYANDNPIGLSDPNGLSAKDTAKGVLSGLLTELKNALFGLLATISDPTTAGSGIWNAAKTPRETTQKFANSVYQSYRDLGTANDYNKGKIFGHTAGFFGLLFVPGGEEVKAVEGISDEMLVCRAGGCSIDSFIQGSNEFKAGLNPTAETPLTGISVNAGASKDTLLSHLPGSYSKAGFSSVSEIEGLGGDFTSSPREWNPFHADINGLTARQLNSIFNIQSIR